MIENETRCYHACSFLCIKYLAYAGYGHHNTCYYLEQFFTWSCVTCYCLEPFITLVVLFLASSTIRTCTQIYSCVRRKKSPNTLTWYPVIGPTWWSSEPFILNIDHFHGINHPFLLHSESVPNRAGSAVPSNRGPSRASCRAQPDRIHGPCWATCRPEGFFFFIFLIFFNILYIKS